MPGRGQPPENEPTCSFLGVVGGGGGQGEVNLPKTSCCARFWGVVGGGGYQEEVIPPKTSMTARFRGLWVVVVGRKR